jgi:6-methylsalicylate decarboxylase
MRRFSYVAANSRLSERRAVLLGLAGAGASALLPRAVAGAELADRIDIHAHLAAPAWIQELSPRGLILPPLAHWSPAKHLEDMDAAGVGTSMLSITAPGLWFGDVASTQRLARAVNDYGATLVRDHPGRFGLFAALPLPDVDASLKEIEYALDELSVRGFGLLTNYGDKWLGDPAFDPVFAELNRRKALVYTHPVTAACCRNLVPGVGDAVIEYGTDTTRAIARYVFGGSAQRFPDVRMIFSHAGGTMPFLIERFDVWSRTAPNPEQVPGGFRKYLPTFYYDTAQSANPVAMRALKSLVPTSHILFGTDYPFRTAIEHVQGLRDCGVFDRQELRAIEHDNAVALGVLHRN